MLHWRVWRYYLHYNIRWTSCCLDSEQLWSNPTAWLKALFAFLDQQGPQNQSSSTLVFQFLLYWGRIYDLGWTSHYTPFFWSLDWSGRGDATGANLSLNKAERFKENLLSLIVGLGWHEPQKYRCGLGLVENSAGRTKPAWIAKDVEGHGECSFYILTSFVHMHPSCVTSQFPPSNILFSLLACLSSASVLVTKKASVSKKL